MLLRDLLLTACNRIIFTFSHLSDNHAVLISDHDPKLTQRIPSQHASQLTFRNVPQVILSVATCSSLQTVVNMFLVNLAVADILVLIICAPVSILQVRIFVKCLFSIKVKYRYCIVHWGNCCFSTFYTNFCRTV